MSKHTPGPWRVSGDSVASVLTNVVLCQTFSPAPYRGEAQREANARLIAAAPDLLDACKMAELTLSLSDNDCRDRPPSGDRCGECVRCGVEYSLRALRLHITKAEGGAS